MSDFLDEPRHPLECDSGEVNYDSNKLFATFRGMAIKSYSFEENESYNSLRKEFTRVADAIRSAYTVMEPVLAVKTETKPKGWHGPQPVGGPFRKHGKHYR